MLKLLRGARSLALLASMAVLLGGLAGGGRMAEARAGDARPEQVTPKATISAHAGHRAHAGHSAGAVRPAEHDVGREHAMAIEAAAGEASVDEGCCPGHPPAAAGRDCLAVCLMSACSASVLPSVGAPAFSSRPGGLWPWMAAALPEGISPETATPPPRA
ncbi:hypothetical protein AL346_12560 [Chelatococcus sp. CO-6]|uniref:hypothetical protein n=1 Tax=Chelatococcus sp. CO-6 TaxID=1702325 RepID=UPI00069FE40D|nr:hypothetical protein [Chelatococcus sp. CO-6]ALA18087.1 hypothetical protein AL346_12560 [Chelatococcus sp. CO-6]